MNNKPTPAFVGASWTVLALGVISYAVGLWNAEMTKSEKGFYAAVFVLGVFAAVSLQKSVRDRADGLPVTALLTRSFGAGRPRPWCPPTSETRRPRETTKVSPKVSETS